MKKYFIIKVLFVLLSFSAYGQRDTYDTIRVGVTTTIHLLFEADIQDYLLGSGEVSGEQGTYKEVLLQQAGERKLRVAAAIEDFSVTNLFIETETGYFNFILEYTEFPKKQIIEIGDLMATVVKTTEEKRVGESLIDEGPERPKNQYLILEDEILKTADRPSEIAMRSQGVDYSVSGIYTNGSEIGFKLIIINGRSISYQLSYINWSIREKGKASSKRGAVEMIEPITSRVLNKESHQNYDKLSMGATGEYIFVYPKFTLSKTKELVIEIGEKEGDRIVELKVNNKQLLKAEFIDGK